jgi:protein TonB
MKGNYLLLLLCLLLSLSAAAQVKSTAPAVDKSDTDKIYAVFDEAPKAPYNFSEYLSQNLHYPDSAIAHNIEGKVVVRFVVKKNGDISRCTVINSVNKYLDEEALRVVSSMPAWNPGKIHGRKVKVWFAQPVVFRLE